MLANRAQNWVEDYLYRARGHRALEQSVFAEGGRRGYSERRLLKAGVALGVTVTGGCWELQPAHASTLVARELDGLTVLPAPRVPVIAGARRAA